MCPGPALSNCDLLNQLHPDTITETTTIKMATKYILLTPDKKKLLVILKVKIKGLEVDKW